MNQKQVQKPRVGINQLNLGLYFYERGVRLIIRNADEREYAR
jgi:hypothetical protein